MKEVNFVSKVEETSCHIMFLWIHLLWFCLLITSMLNFLIFCRYYRDFSNIFKNR